MLLSHTEPGLLVAGTRPEVIKLWPIYQEYLAQRPNLSFQKPIYFCHTGQHVDLVNRLLELFSITPDFVIPSLEPQRTLSDLAAHLLLYFQNLFIKKRFAFVIVQGDTLTAMIAGLAAFYAQIPVYHVEAGLRSFDLNAPFPEEMHRQVLSKLASLHFCPTQTNAQHLTQENINKQNIFVTGNTVIDALFQVLEKISTHLVSPHTQVGNLIKKLKLSQKKIVILTMHRRESLPEFRANIPDYIAQVCTNIKLLCSLYQDVTIVFIRHPNMVGDLVAECLNRELTVGQLEVLLPVDFVDMVFLLDNCDFVISDSGGIVEEAISLGKKVVCIREKTERMEPGLQDWLFLVGCNQREFLWVCKKIYTELNWASSQTAPCVFGDGMAAKRIVEIIKHHEQLKPTNVFNLSRCEEKN